MYKEARYLENWCKEAFPQKEGLIPKAKTIKNALGKTYRELKEQNHPGINPETPWNDPETNPETNPEIKKRFIF